MNGILCMDKPAGFTSFDVIAKLRGILHMKRLGHAGTLDPMATGILPVFVGYATKACHILPNEEKSYLAGFQLGQVSTTQDSTGEILETHEFSGMTEQKILQAVPTGEIMQIPPMYSAVSVNGKRLYELARQGKEIERPARPAVVRQVRCLHFDAETGRGTLEIECGAGTYVRTLLHDMGQTLGCGAVMTELRRSVSAGFTLADCHTFEEVQKFADENRIEEILIPIEQVFASLPKIMLNEKQTFYYKNGVRLYLSQFQKQLVEHQNRYAVYGTLDGFLGTAFPDFENQVLRIERNLYEPKGAES